MASAGELRAFLLEVPDSLVGVGMSEVADAWAQAAATFAALTQGSTKPEVEQIQALLGQGSKNATELLTLAGMAHEMMYQLAASF